MNEDVARQKMHTEIVFNQLEHSHELGTQVQAERRSCSTATIIFNVLNFVVVLAAALIIQIQFLAKDDPTQIVYDWVDENSTQDRKNFVETLAFAGCGLALLIFLISTMSKRVLCRLVPCCSLAVPSVVTRVANLIMQALAIALATVLVLN